MAKCVDCGYLASESLDDRNFTALTERDRHKLQRVADSLELPFIPCCYLEFDGFMLDEVWAPIDCPHFVRRIPNLSPKQHLDMRQIVEARQEAKEAAAIQRRESRIIAVLTVAVTFAAIIVAALIGRGIILG